MWRVQEYIGGEVIRQIALLILNLVFHKEPCTVHFHKSLRPHQDEIGQIQGIIRVCENLSGRIGRRIENNVRGIKVGGRDIDSRGREVDSRTADVAHSLERHLLEINGVAGVIQQRQVQRGEEMVQLEVDRGVGRMRSRRHGHDVGVHEVELRRGGIHLLLGNFENQRIAVEGGVAEFDLRLVDALVVAEPREELVGTVGGPGIDAAGAVVPDGIAGIDQRVVDVEGIACIHPRDVAGESRQHVIDAQPVPGNMEGRVGQHRARGAAVFRIEGDVPRKILRLFTGDERQRGDNQV